MYGPQSNIIPPVTINDLGDMSMVTLGDLKAGTWVAVNVWNGSKDSKVSISLLMEELLSKQKGLNKELAKSR